MTRGQTIQICKKDHPEEMNHKTKELLRELLHHGTFETTTFYADRAGLSWNTAKDYLECFAKQKWIFHYQKGNRDFWKAVAEK